MSEKLRPLPIGLADFEEIRRSSGLYVDKTKYIYDLIKLQDGGLKPPPYFIARPRRFGKSLTLNTIRAIFEGKKDLFSGLWIEDRWNWSDIYPVLHLSMSQLGIRAVNEVGRRLCAYVDKLAEHVGIDVSKYTSSGDYSGGFVYLIEKLYEKYNKGVVVLVDEYDCPIVSNLDNIDEAKKIRDEIRPFYRQLKETERYQRFLLLTGVSKFSRAGVFSALNNLKDITFSERFAYLMGITVEELREYFGGYIDELAKKEKTSREEVIEKIRYWYNGFCFSLEDTNKRVYNPFSLLNLFSEGVFSNYWYVSGSPKFLIDLLKAKQYRVDELKEKVISLSRVDSYEPDDLNLTALLLQAGYLTVVEKIDDMMVRIDYPNYEVESSFLEGIAAAYIGDDAVEQEQGMVYELKESLEEGDVDKFIELINSIYERIDYSIHMTIKRKEQMYQVIMYLILELFGIKVGAEVKTRRGRIDMVAEVGDRTYIMEFKVDGDAKDVLKQIEEKGYAERFKGKEKGIILVGVNVSSDEGKIVEWESRVLRR